MSVSPLEYRYGRKEVKDIFSEESKLRYMLKVEEKLAQAQAEFNIIPKEAFLDIQKAVDSNAVKVERVKEIENEIKHDVMAIVKALSEKCNEGQKYVHFGVTSNDIIDTATALQIRDFYSYFMEDLLHLQKSMANLVDEHRLTVMLGRTHGQHASPVTFGLKMAVYLAEVNRHIERAVQAKHRVIAGKIMGPVGTGASLGDAALELQDRVMEVLGISSEVASSQIVNRDRYVELHSLLNGVVTSLEKFATEIRNLQRPEIDEVSEYFDSSKQVGSSSMPSKVNPINSENVVSLSRLVRSFILPEYEAAVTWHERDLTNSASERFSIPYACILTDHVLVKMAKVFEGLVVKKENMLRNLKADDFVLSERFVSELTLSGVPRQDAHEMVREASMKAYANKTNLLKSLEDMGILAKLSKEKVDAIKNPLSFVGRSDRICTSVLEQAESIRKISLGAA